MEIHSLIPLQLNLGLTFPLLFLLQNLLKVVLSRLDEIIDKLVIPFQTYYIEVQADPNSNWAFSDPRYYKEGYAYVSDTPQLDFSFLFRTEGFLAPPDPTTQNCTRQIYK